MFESYAFPKGSVRKMSCFSGTREVRKPGQEKPAVGRDRQLPGGARAGQQSSKTWEQTKLMKFSLQELSSHLEALNPAQLAPPPRLQKSPPALSLSWSVLPAETLPAAAGSPPCGDAAEASLLIQSSQGSKGCLLGRDGLRNEIGTSEAFSC